MKDFWWNALSRFLVIDILLSMFSTAQRYGESRCKKSTGVVKTVGIAKLLYDKSSIQNVILKNLGASIFLSVVKSIGINKPSI